MSFHYVVVIVDGGGRLLRGPYGSKDAAEKALPAAKLQCQELDKRSPYYGFGTCEFEHDPGVPGILDKEDARHG